MGRSAARRKFALAFFNGIGRQAGQFSRKWAWRIGQWIVHRQCHILFKQHPRQSMPLSILRRQFCDHPVLALRLARMARRFDILSDFSASAAASVSASGFSSTAVVPPDSLSRCAARPDSVGKRNISVIESNTPVEVGFGV